MWHILEYPSVDKIYVGAAQLCDPMKKQKGEDFIAGLFMEKSMGFETCIIITKENFKLCS